MNRLVYSLAVVCALLMPQISHAYDIDTHFYHAYSMARYAGIGHDVALFLATADQWADESELTSPLALPKTPIQTVEFLRKQRFIHFGCALRTQPDFNVIELLKMNMGAIFSEPDKLAELFNNLTCQVSGQGNDPFASMIETMGLKNRDLLIAGAGLHTLMDSYAHAGYPNHEGHAAHGHWPDRPFARPEFYKDMIHTFFRALVAIRTLLPDSALDKSNSNYREGSQTLANKYVEIPAVKKVIYFNPLRDSDLYAQTAFERALRAAMRAGIVESIALAPQFQMPDLLQSARAALGPNENLPHKMLQLWALNEIDKAAQGKHTLLKMKEAVALLVPGRPAGAITPAEMVEKAVLFFTANHIPLRPTTIADAADGKPNYHPTELEQEGSQSNYTLEMKIRVDEYKELIADLWGIKLDFGGDLGADGKKIFLYRESQADQDHWDEFFKNIIEKGVDNIILDSIDRGIFHRNITRGNPMLQAASDVQYYQYPEAFNEMIREGKVGWLADDKRIQQIKDQDEKAGYSQRQLSVGVERTIRIN